MQVDGSRLAWFGYQRRCSTTVQFPYYRGTRGRPKGRHGFLNRFARSMFESGYTRRGCHRRGLKT